MDCLNTFLPESKALQYVLFDVVVIAVGALMIHQLNHPPRKYPAPNIFVEIPYIRETWFAWLTLKGDPDMRLSALQRKLGTVVRIGPNKG
jgi:hypothetical protein